MLSNEKERNSVLFDQITLVERMERHLKSGGESVERMEFEFSKSISQHF